MSTLTLKNIVKEFTSGSGASASTTQVIKGVDLEVKDQEFVVFVGPSGCGKSTLMRMIAGLENATSGDILIDGKRMNDIGPAERGLAMVFQSYALYPHMTVGENMGFSLKLAGVSKEERAEKVNAAAEVLQLGPLLDRKPKALSGGQRQRVAIGRAIVRNPSIFLFDEPLSNLDAALRVQMRIELARLHAELKATMIYVTHDQVEAMTMADKIVVLQGGVVEQVGSPMELYHHPRNRFVAGFIGSPKMNFLDITVTGVAGEGVTVRLPDGSERLIPVVSQTEDGASVIVGDSLTLGVRPEHLMLDAQGPFSGQVQVIERLGGVTSLYLATPDGSGDTPIGGLKSDEQSDSGWILMADGDVNSRVGDSIRYGFDTERAHLFTREGLALQNLNRHPLTSLTRQDNSLSSASAAQEARA
ncbi:MULTISPECIES: ABC transporter ATP-binding protein [Cobetia]|uniref:Sn-glycerol-3-phosphate ABC transporter ATP-binding protein UgpC n=2 Tax=Cobetia TaxID=204286 RepID=A0AAP4TVS3_9GAMM|nr:MULTISPECIES: sn-glycerol-3-phosphate ABC transporter ATP-binding protein UgpC [Cobetia]MBR9799584.1 sn-glycerol-3-phosphate ABC transporter ATP-binding protein UgpC [Gammaproteobacteria bacterium]KPM76804.1 ABC transporter [Cobetia sp. UCD-24C]MBU3006764.1 sn-glycerol-3-phosphate ABC transporter ATP-binding protein UgpC [Cobetia amphilecti]MDO6671104.1 sn-glycerol-3-phosphate ABC transporter ATP-binding protein UgpC [Cobetia amphilecti]MDO6816519.1 sn-glycerol-3-phosphate ABC transporter A